MSYKISLGLKTGSGYTGSPKANQYTSDPGSLSMSSYGGWSKNQSSKTLYSKGVKYTLTPGGAYSYSISYSGPFTAKGDNYYLNKNITPSAPASIWATAEGISNTNIYISRIRFYANFKTTLQVPITITIGNVVFSGTYPVNTTGQAYCILTNTANSNATVAKVLSGTGFWVTLNTTKNLYVNTSNAFIYLDYDTTENIKPNIYINNTSTDKIFTGQSFDIQTTALANSYYTYTVTLSNGTVSSTTETKVSANNKTTVSVPHSGFLNNNDKYQLWTATINVFGSAGYSVYKTSKSFTVYPDPRYIGTQQAVSYYVDNGTPQVSSSAFSSILLSKYNRAQYNIFDMSLSATNIPRSNSTTVHIQVTPTQSQSGCNTSGNVSISGFVSKIGQDNSLVAVQTFDSSTRPLGAPVVLSFIPKQKGTHIVYIQALDARGVITTSSVKINVQQGGLKGFVFDAFRVSLSSSGLITIDGTKYTRDINGTKAAYSVSWDSQVSATIDSYNMLLDAVSLYSSEALTNSATTYYMLKTTTGTIKSIPKSSAPVVSISITDSNGQLTTVSVILDSQAQLVRSIKRFDDSVSIGIGCIPVNSNALLILKAIYINIDGTQYRLDVDKLILLQCLVSNIDS